MVSSSAAISFLRLTPANKYSTLNEPAVGGTANEDARGEDANTPPVVQPLLEDGEEPVPTATEDVQRGVVAIGEDEARGKT